MNLDAIYELLPAIHRRRDGEAGEPLRALLQIIAEQASLIEADIGRTYDNWFIETCEEWAAPYLGELVGYAPASGEVPPPGAVPVRREVARTIAWRRRKGTLRLLEDLAEAIAGWPATAFECGERTSQTQSLRLARPDRGRLVDIRCGGALARIGRHRDRLARLVDVRRAGSARAPGLPAPDEVALEVWRLRSFPLTDQPAACREEAGPHCYTFSALAADMPLFLRTDAPGLNPLRLTRHMLSAPRSRGERSGRADPHFAEPDASGRVAGFAIHAPGWGDIKSADGLLPAHRIIPANLEGWRYQPPRGHIAVDPELGRIAFPPRQIPRRPVTVTWHTGFSADIGGGEYIRPLASTPGAEIVTVRGLDQLKAALAPYAGIAQDDGTVVADPQQPPARVIEIEDSGIYTAPFAIYLAPNASLQIRAGQARRPVLRLLDWQVSQADNFFVHGEVDSRLVLDGLLVVGRGIQLEGALASFTLRHTTLVPGWALGPHCDPRRPSEPSVESIDCPACISIERCVTGSIQINNDEVSTDPTVLRVSDSVIDATGIDCDHPQCEAIGAAGSRPAFARLEVVRSTVIGRVMAHQLDRGDNSIFLGAVTIARRQRGCMRFSYVAPRSRTPRRYRCQPDLAEATLRAEHAAPVNAGQQDTLPTGTAAPPPTELSEADFAAARRAVRPVFDSLRYGTPTYARLHQRCDPAIVRGAEDRSEMGVFNHLQNPWRVAALIQRLAEYTPAGTDAGVVFAD
ncbi:hypothetical protein [Novosphingobium sp. 9U]|uniref:hypothetical protein n=1 Tax=Novosphingobium sp. 9U TaxID=2653158 RepID=UPI0012EF3024|nr:hypothetical protein [Novosphingobium sp. 9U]VWX50891.1 conserved hypothetical protein [Novosphingobium sp. 9U]